MSPRRARERATGVEAEPEAGSDVSGEGRGQALLRWVAKVDHVRSLGKGRYQKIGLVLALILFVASVAFALNNLPEISDVDPIPLVLVAVVGVPLTLLSNIEEYRLSARVLGHRVGFGDGMRVSVIASAANWLPIPGSVMVRTASLRQMGTRTGRALMINAVTGIAWIGVALTVGGAVLAITTDAWWGVALLVGLFMLVPVWVYVRRLHEPAEAVRLNVALLLVELLAVATTVLRFALICVALGTTPSVEQAVALALSVIVASSVGFLPRGLGLAEILGGVFARVTGLTAAFGVLTVAIDRVIGQAMYVLFVLALLVTGNAPSRKPIEVDDRRLDAAHDADMPEPPIRD